VSITRGFISGSNKLKSRAVRMKDRWQRIEQMDFVDSFINHHV